MNIEKRFWDKVDKSGDCWEWTGATNTNGYGIFRAKGKPFLAHRFAYSLVYGNIPDGICICHHCDNPGCIKLSHLFAGTQGDNVHDAIAKGRLDNQGENNGRSKLTEKDVHEIRRLCSLGVKRTLLVEMWGVGLEQIGKIVNRKSWRHT